jgi:signal transduction histidine kinase
MKSAPKKALRSNIGNTMNEAVHINNSIPENDKLKLINELQVHQIELEIQNEELQRLKQGAELISHKYSQLYNFAPSAYLTVSEYGYIQELNLTAAKMLGMDRVLLKDKILSHFVTQSSKTDFEYFLQKIFKSCLTEFCEVSINSFTHENYDLYLSGIAKAGEEYCFITAIDISERKKLEKDLIITKERAEESDRLKTAFLQNMSHEIRSPLNAIKGFSQLLILNYDNKERLERYTKIIDQRSDDLLDIINDLLDIAKIESGQLTLTFEKCNLKTFMEDIEAQFKEFQIRLNKQHIHFELSTINVPNDIVFITDVPKLRQILINLLTNAFKFTTQGKITGACKMAKGNLVFFVSDTGMGIPADKQKVVFERFIQLKQGQKESVGTGLGLSIVQALVNMLSGTLSLKSAPGEGSTFTFTIPLEQETI